MPMITRFNCFFTKEEEEEEEDRQVNASSITTTNDLLSTLNQMPTENSFIIHLKYIHHLQLHFPQQIELIPTSSSSFSLVTFDDLLAYPQTVLSTILFDYDTSLTIIDDMSSILIDFASNMIANAPPHDTSTRRPQIMSMTLNLFAYSSYHNEIYHHEIDQDLERALEVSFNDEDNFRPVSHNLSTINEILKKLDIGSSCSSVTKNTCSICLEELLCEGISVENNHNVVSTPCSHVYHKDCIVRWLETSGMCPLCRFAIL